MTYIEKMTVDMSDHIKGKFNSSIKNILNLLDAVDISKEQRMKLRRVILDEINSNYDEFICVITYIQEKQNGLQSNRK